MIRSVDPGSACLMISLALFLVASDRAWVSFVGWVFGGLGCVGFTAVFLVADTKRRSSQPGSTE
jgi:hypothetical protein